MLSRHSSGFEQVLNEILRKLFKELPFHRILVRGLHHVTRVALEFIIERQGSLAARELCSCVTVRRILCGDKHGN